MFKFSSKETNKEILKKIETIISENKELKNAIYSLKEELRDYKEQIEIEKKERIESLKSPQERAQERAQEKREKTINAYIRANYDGHNGDPAPARRLREEAEKIFKISDFYNL